MPAFTCFHHHYRSQVRIALLSLNYYQEMHIVFRAGEAFSKNVARRIDRFIARTLFHTSELHLSSERGKALVPHVHQLGALQGSRRSSAYRIALEHPSDHYSAPLRPLVEEIYTDDDLRAEALVPKECCMIHAQALSIAYLTHGLDSVERGRD